MKQKRFFLSPSIRSNPKQKWTLPVCFKTGEARDCELLSPEVSKLDFPARTIFFANADGKGYYRSAYAPAQYEDLAARAESALTPAERVSLVGDEWALVQANMAGVVDYLNLAGALESDTNAQVFSSTAEVTGTIADKIASAKQERDGLATWIRRNYAPEYAKLGPPTPSDSSNTRELRAELLSLLVKQGDDADLQTEARKIASQFLDDPASVDPNLGIAALRAAAENGNAALFDRLQKIYETSSNPDLQESALRLLVAFRDPTLLKRGLTYSVSGKVRNQDTAIQLAYGLRNPDTRNATWSFIKKHWTEVQPNLTTDLGSYLVRATGSFCSVDARDDVKHFFAVHQLTATDTYLRHALEQIEGCVELRRLQEPNLEAWLAAQPVS